MRGIRKTTDELLGADVAEVQDLEVSKQKKVVCPYPYKIDYIKYDGDTDKMEPQKVDSKNNPVAEDRNETLKRSRFFANYINGKYKVIMIYKGAFKMKRLKFDIFPRKNKLKYNFWKSKGILI